MSGFGNLQPRTGNKDSVRLEEVIKMHKWPADEWSQVRFLPGKILPVKRHWIKIMAGKDVKKEITIPRYCIAFDVNNENEPRKNEKGKPIHCPYCDLVHGNEGTARYEFFYLANAIIREVQEDMPARAKKIERTKEEKKSGFKDIRSKTWTPVEVCRITSTVAGRVKELGDGNFAKVKGEKKAFDVTHVKYGVDIRVKFKPKGAGTDKYSADKDERTPLTEDEQAYLTWRLDESLVEVTGRMDQKQALEDFKRMDLVGAAEVDDDEDGYSLGDDDGKKGKKGKKKGKKKSAAFDDDDDDEPKKSKKKKSRDDDDDDEDEAPKKSKKKKAAFDDEDDEPKKSKKKKSKSDDDDEDDEPKKKKKSSGDKSKSKDKVKSSKKKSKSDDDDEAPKKKKKKPVDDDDDDEPPKKKKKSSDDGKKSKSKDKASAKKGKKKKSAWDDDDE